MTLQIKQHMASCICIICALTFLIGCAGSLPTPKHVDDLCEIFEVNRRWYKDANASHQRWGIPIPVLMAIMHQESKFQAKVKPPRTTCLFIFPGPRPSSAYGYSQALDETWQRYIKATGNSGADRDNFADAVDFIGWYCDQSHRRCGISRNDAYNLYLAYHEGQGGFLKKTFRRKPWLLKVAKKVQRQAGIYTQQLSSCEHKFRKSRSCLWPF